MLTAGFRVLTAAGEVLTAGCRVLTAAGGLKFLLVVGGVWREVKRAEGAFCCWYHVGGLSPLQEMLVVVHPMQRSVGGWV